MSYEDIDAPRVKLDRSRDIGKTRKPFVCSGCKRTIPPGSKAHETWVLTDEDEKPYKDKQCWVCWKGLAEGYPIWLAYADYGEGEEFEGEYNTIESAWRATKPIMSAQVGARVIQLDFDWETEKTRERDLFTWKQGDPYPDLEALWPLNP
jgi:hypothetical protein